MIAREQAGWQPLGTGRIAPQGTLAERALADRVAAYKRQVAGRYRSVSPADLATALPPGPYVLSPKLDGETWFVRVAGGEAWLLSPTGRVIADVPATAEAARLLSPGRGVAGRGVLLAGELYADGSSGHNGCRHRVHDLHALLGGGAEAPVEHLRFAAFDLLDDAGDDAQRLPFPLRAERLVALLAGGELCHAAAFERAADSRGVLEAYDRLVTREGHEGLVVRSAGGQILKVKPEITIDAAVVGFTERPTGGVAELLVALVREGGAFQLLGRVDTGFTGADRRELAGRLRLMAADSSYLAASRAGALFRFVRPEVVVEVKCNDILTVRSGGEPVRRMALAFDAGASPPWRAMRPLPAASMMHAVFRRARDDKAVDAVAIRWSQVTDLAPVEDEGSAETLALPRSQVLRREVFVRREPARLRRALNGGRAPGTLSVRKVVLWKTNKDSVDPLYPPYVAFFTDFAPGRQQPLSTDLRVASSLDRIHALADAWIKRHVTKGWVPRTMMSDAAPLRADGRCPGVPAAPLPVSCRGARGFRLDLELSFARTSSANFHVAVRRIKALAPAGRLTVEGDEKGRPRHYAVALRRDALVESVYRIESLLRVISRWSGAEVSVNGEPLGSNDIEWVLVTIAEVAACWRRQKTHADGKPTGEANPCRAGFALGCRQLRFSPSAGFPGLPRDRPAWYAVGVFDGEAVALDKDAVLAQVDSPPNETLAVCPFFSRENVADRVRELPDRLDPAADPARWAFGYAVDTRKPVWVFPKHLERLPYDVTFECDTDRVQGGRATPLGNTGPFSLPMVAPSLHVTPRPARNIPAARYAEVCGQDAAVEAVRDYAELPLEHPELFERAGVRPGRGLLLWGPPGNGKTLLARAVAGETAAHLEVVSGPEVLSKWVGEGERRLREVFERAARAEPSVVLMDELDAVAGSRDAADSRHLRQLVSQLLVLLDGLAERGRVLVIATTNRPQDIDPAILRPGRIDRTVHLGPPDARGRAALFGKLLAGMPVADDVRPGDLAALTGGFSGARIEHVAREAGLAAIKEAIAAGPPLDNMRVRREHFARAIGSPSGRLPLEASAR